MVATLKIVIGVIVVAVFVTAVVLGIVLGTRKSDKCSSVETPTNLRFDHNYEDSTLRITWEYPVNEDNEDEEDECEIAYGIHYTIDGATTGGTKDTTTNLVYVIENVTPCTEIKVLIWAISESEKISEGRLEETFDVPVTEVPKPSNIEFEVVEDNLQITWERPEKLSKCQINYEIEVYADREPIEGDTVDINSFSIPTDSFCLRVDVKITTIYDETDSENAEATYLDPGVPNLTTNNAEGTTDFTVNWEEHLKAVQCGLSYRVSYRVLGVDEDVVIDYDPATLRATFRVEYCEEAYIVVVAIKDDLTSEESTEEVTRYPEVINAVTSLSIIENENHWVLSWPPIVIGRCTISYHIVFETDLESDSRSYSTQESSFAIPNEIYCHEVGATIYATLNELTSDSETIESANYDILPVEGLVSSFSDGILEVSWDAHPKAQSCFLSYRVIYSYDDTNDPKETSETTITFDASTQACAVATVSVTTIKEDSPDWVYRTNTISAAQLPNDVQISNVNVVVSDETKTITWDAITETEDCTDIQYKIDFMTDLVSLREVFTSDNSYQIPEDIYCFALVFQITPIFGTIMGVTYVHQLDENVMPAVTDLEYSVDSDKLTATWQHYKHTICALEYRVEYTPNGRSSATTETSSTEAELDFVSCSEGVLSVTPIATGARIGTADSIDISYEVSPQFDAVDVIATEKQTDGSLLLTWTEKDFGECTVQYNVVVTGINPTPHNDAAQPIAIDFDDFCFQIKVDIAPIVDTVTGKVASSVITTDIDGVTILDHVISSDELTISWEEHPKKELCSLRYRVNYNIDGDTIYASPGIEETSYLFNYIYCATADIAVTTITSERNGNTADLRIPAAFPAVINEQVSNVEITPVDGRQQLSWNGLDIGRCNIIYRVIIVSEGIRETHLNVESPYNIAEEEICYNLDALVAAGIDIGTDGTDIIYGPDSASIDRLIGIEAVTITRAKVVSDQLEVTWSHSKAATCPLQYKVDYRINDESIQDDIVTETTKSFDYVYCADAVVSVIPVINSIDGPEETYEVSAEFPEDINEQITNVEITPVDGRQQLSWKGLDIGRCNVIYRVIIVSEGIRETHLNVESPYNILEDEICYNLDALVAAGIDIGTDGTDIIYGPNSASIDRLIGIEAVTITRAEVVSYQLEVTWSHSKAATCPLQYKVDYRINDESIQDDIVTETTKSFDYVYCADAVVSVIPVINSIDGPEETYEVSAEFPEDINEQVTNVEITPVDGRQQLSWKGLDIGRCNVIYRVIIVSEGIRETHLNVESPYNIPEDEICYNLDALVAAGIDIRTDGTDIIYGPNSASIDRLIGIEAVTITRAEVVSDQLEVAWSHSKAATCPLQYNVDYRINDESIQDDTVTETTKSFDYVYCADAVVSVIPVINSIDGPEETYDVSAEFPEDIDEQVTNVEITPVDGRQQLSWEGLDIGRCNVIYRVIIVSEGIRETHLNVESPYNIPDDEICYNLDALVAAGIDIGTDIIYGPNSASIDRLIGIEAVTITRAEVVSDQLEVTWSHSKAATCPLQYKVDYRINDESIQNDIVTETTKSFDYVYCADAVVSVISVINSIDGPEETYDVSAEFPEDINEQVTNVEITPVDGRQQLSWEGLDIGRCNVIYRVIIVSEGIRETHLNVESPYNIPDDEICYNLDALVAAGIDIGTDIIYGPNSASIDRLIGIEAVTITRAEVVSDQLEVTWSHSKAATCPLQYNVDYRINDESIQDDTVTETTKSFDYVYCADAVVSVIPVINSIDGPEETYDVSAEFPEDINEQVSNVEITPVDGRQQLSWKGLDIGRCNVIYRVIIVSEGIRETHLNVESPYNIPEDEICYNLDALIAAGIDIGTDGTDIIYGPNSASIDRLIGIEAVTITRAEVVSDQLEVTWSHSKAATCPLQYKVDYRINDESIQDDIVTETTKSFDYIYCADAVVSVIPVINSIDGPEETYDVSAEFPEDISEQVTNVEITPVDGRQQLSWEGLDIGRCNVIYRVIIVSEGIRETHLNVESPYNIPEDEICYNLDALVAAGIDIGTDGTDIIYGPNSASIDRLIGIEAVTITRAEVVSDQLEVTWSHSKAATCPLQYKVDYRINDESIQDDIVTETTKSFDYVYCADAVVSVIPVINSIDGPEETYDVSAEFPEDISEQVTNVEITPVDGRQQLSWKGLDIGRCNVIYRVIIVSEGIRETHLNVESPYNIPEDEICYNLDALVAAGIDIGTDGTDIIYGPNSASIDRLIGIEAVTITRAEVVSDQLEVTWSHSKAATCPLQYKVDYRINDESIQDDIVTETTKSFDYVYCADAVVSVISVINSIDGPEETYDVSAEFPEDINEQVTNVEITPVDGRQQLSWEGLDIGRCNVIYRVIIVSEGIRETHLNVESPYNIPDDEICYNLDALVAAGIDIGTDIIYGPNSASIDRLIGIEAVTITRAEVVSDQLEVTWSHSKAATCPLQYNVDYRINDESIQDDTVTETTKSFDYVYCADAVVSVIPVINSIDGPEETYDVSAEFPEDINEQVSNVEITPVDGRQQLSWKGLDIGRCNVIYRVIIVSEGIRETHLNVESPYNIPEDEICYNLDALIAAGIDIGTDGTDIIYGPNSASIDRLIGIEAVTITRAEVVSDQLEVTWSHSKAATCPLQYKVDYRINDESIQDDIVTETTKSFDYIYCADAVVSVIPVINSIDGPEETYDVSAEFPEDISEQVTNVEITPVDGRQQLSWKGLDIGRCNVIYRVIIVSEGIRETHLNVESPYNIPEDEICYNLDALVAAGIDIGTDGTDIIYGPNSASIVRLIGIEAVTITRAEVVSAQLEVTWSHSKAATCPLQYNVDYRINGESIQDDIVTETTKSFDYVYCADAVVSVIPVINSIDGPEETYDVSAEFPEDINEQVTNVEITPVDGRQQLSWKGLDIGRCNVIYRVIIVSEGIRETHLNVESPYNIPEDEICYNLDALVAAGIDIGTDGTDIIYGPNSASTDTLIGIEAVTISGAEVVSDQLKVTWSHSKAATCPLQYKVDYRINGESSIQDALVSETTKSFDYVYCADAVVSVIPVINSNDGTEETEAVSAEFPAVINEQVSNVEITPVDGTQQLSWNGLHIGRCNVIYRVIIVSEGIRETHLNVESPYNIPEEEICYNLDALVAAGIDIGTDGTDIIYGPESASIDRPIDIEAVTILKAEVVSDQLKVTWSHSKDDTCPLEYKVDYRINDVSIQDDLVTETTKSFNYEYCTASVVSVIPAINSNDGPEQTYNVPADDEPSTVGKVKDIKMDTSSGVAIISWESPDYINYCTHILYTVTAATSDTDSGENSEYTTESCFITLNEYCPTTVSVRVKSINGYLIDGDIETANFTCDSNESFLDQI